MRPWCIDGILMITPGGTLGKSGSSLSVHRINGLVSNFHWFRMGGESSDGVNRTVWGGALPNAYYIPRHNIMLQGIDMDTEEENIFMRGRDNNGKWEWVESG